MHSSENPNNTSIMETYFVQGMVKVRKYGMSEGMNDENSIWSWGCEKTHGALRRYVCLPSPRGFPKAHLHLYIAPKNPLGLRRASEIQVLDK